MTTLEHIKARIVTIAEHTRPYLKKAWTIGCAYVVKFVDWCRATYHKARPHVIVGWKRLHPYLKQAWYIGGVAAEKVVDCCKETYRLAKPHVITGLENLRQWFARLSPQGKNAVMIVSTVLLVSLLGVTVARMSGNDALNNEPPQSSAAAVAESHFPEEQSQKVPTIAPVTYERLSQSQIESLRKKVEQGDAEALNDPTNDVESTVQGGQLKGDNGDTAKKYPNELRIVAQSLAGEMSPNAEKALATPSEQEIRLKFVTNKLDLAKVKSNDAEIQFIANDGLSAVTEVITRMDRINELPRPDNWAPFWGGVVDGFLVGSGYAPTGASVRTIQEETDKGNAIAIEVQALAGACSKADMLHRLLPRVSKQYCAAPTKMKNDERISVRFHSLIAGGGMYILTNQEEPLQDCLFEFNVSNSSGKKATFCCFTEQWNTGQSLFYHGSFGTDIGNGEIIGEQCVPAVDKVEVTLLSPQFSTLVQYSYDKAERGKTHAILFQNVKAAGQYQKKEPGLLSDWQRSFTTTLTTGGTDLPACRYSVTFIKHGLYTKEGDVRETWYRDLSGWKDAESVKIEPGNVQLTFEPDEVDVIISFPDSTHTLEYSWTIDN